jgi:hypothetical protein
MLGHLFFQRQPVIIYAMRSEYSTMIWLWVRTFGEPLLRDWQILKLGNVLTVKQKNKLAVKQKNTTTTEKLPPHKLLGA